MARNARFVPKNLTSPPRSFIIYSKTKSNPSDDDSSFFPFMTNSDFVATDVVGVVGWLCDKCNELGSPISQLNIYAHAGGGGFYIGSDFITEEYISGYSRMLSFLQPFFTKDAVVVFDACALGFSRGLLMKLSKAFGIPVRSYRDLQNPNWIRPKGEGPSVVCNATKCQNESKDSWVTKDGKPIIKTGSWMTDMLVGL